MELKIQKILFGALALSLAACSASQPRGRQVSLKDSLPGEEAAAPVAAPVVDTETYVASGKKGNVLDVPESPEDAAIFHFGLGQAYSLDNDPQRAIESYRATLVHDPKSALVRSRLAAELVKVGNFGEAKTLCEESIALDPKYMDSYLLLAGIQVAAKEYDKAIATYRTALKIDNNNRDALLYLGVTLAEIRHTKEALLHLERLVKLKDSSESNIDQSVAYYYLAKIYEQTEQKAKAMQAYKMALEKRPSFAKAALALSDLYLAQKDITKAYSVLKESFAESPSSELAERLAERHLEQGDYKGAVIYLETLVEEDPTNENLKLRLALVYWQIRWVDKAQAMLIDLHQRYPASSEISYYLGELYLEKNEFSLAISYYNQVAPDYSKYDQVASRIVYAYRQDGKLEGAENYLLETMRKRPDLVALYPVLAAVYEDQNKLPLARAVLEKGEKLFPEDENIVYYLGFTFDRLGQKEKALATMEKLLTINPENPNALNFVGYTLLDMGKKLDLAQEYLLKAMRLKPNDAFILDSYGWLLYRTGRNQEAMKQLEKAYVAKPDEGVIAEHLADIYTSLNMPRKALAVYEKALKSGGDREFTARVQTKIANVREVLANNKLQPKSKTANSAAIETRDPASQR